MRRVTAVRLLIAIDGLQFGNVGGFHHRIAARIFYRCRLGNFAARCIECGGCTGHDTGGHWHAGVGQVHFKEGDRRVGWRKFCFNRRDCRFFLGKYDVLFVEHQLIGGLGHLIVGFRLQRDAGVVQLRFNGASLDRVRCVDFKVVAGSRRWFIDESRQVMHRQLDIATRHGQVDDAEGGWRHNARQCFGVAMLRGMIDGDRAGTCFRQRITQGRQTCSQCGGCRDTRRRRLQGLHATTDGLGTVGQCTHAFRRSGFTRGKQALDVLLGGAGDFGDFRHIRHGEGAVHGMQRTYQAFVGQCRRRLCIRQPAIHGFQMGADFRVEDFAQHAIQ